MDTTGTAQQVFPLLTERALDHPTLNTPILPPSSHFLWLTSGLQLPHTPKPWLLSGQSSSVTMAITLSPNPWLHLVTLTPSQCPLCQGPPGRLTTSESH